LSYCPSLALAVGATRRLRSAARFIRSRLRARSVPLPLERSCQRQLATI